MTNKKTFWSKLTGLSDDELEKETWYEDEVVEKTALDEMEEEQEENNKNREALDEDEVFVLDHQDDKAKKSQDKSEDEESFLGLKESWGHEEEGQLAVDVYQSKDKVVIKSAIAGVKQDDLDITIADDTVTISGSRKHSDKIRDNDYFYQECYWGKFSRSVVLPFDIDEPKAKAKLEDGILTITLPIVKDEEEFKKPKKKKHVKRKKK